MTETTAWYCRQIAARCTADEAQTLGYVAMLHRIGALKAKPRESASPKARRGLLQQIEALRKRFAGLDLRAEDEQIAPQDWASAIENLLAITQAAQTAITAIELRRRHLRLHVLPEADARERARKDVV
jgi:hypothetical protein